MKKIIAAVMFTLVGCSQQVVDTYEGISLNRADIDDKSFYVFQQKCMALNKKQPTAWMKLLTAEGDSYVVLNWGFFQTKYGRYLSQAYNDWLNHLNKTEQIVEDGGLMIAHDKLRDYLIELENLVNKHPDFVAIKDVKSRLSWYVYLYLAGVDNTPVYNQGSYYNGQGSSFLLPEVKLSYEKFLAENKNSKYYPLVGELYEKLKQNNFQWDRQIDEWHIKFCQKHLN